MNKTQQLLKEREKEFNEKFGSVNGDYFRDFDTPTKVKAYIATTLSLLLKSIKEELEIMEQSLPNSKCRNAESEMFGRCFDCEKTKGYNSALSDISTLISETISNIQTK